MSRKVAVALIGLVGFLPGGSEAHEERLMVGRVELIEPARRLLVVADVQSGERRRMEIDPETEVILCQGDGLLSAVRAGALVRVKYLDKPGGAAEALSILLLGRARQGKARP